MSRTHHDTGQRLASLDILRGLDLFLLLFLQPVVVGIGRALDVGWLNAVLYQLDHEVWAGFRVWDIVMPLFLFMVGTSMPFSFAKYRSPGVRSGKLYGKILYRVVILFLLGMIVQGNLLGLDPHRIYIYNNTLQAIAVGYLIAAMIYLHMDTLGQIVATAALLVIYAVPMMLRGDYSPEGNFAYSVDLLVIGPYRGDITYTWVWSSLTFGVTVMLGVFAGRIIRAGSNARAKAGALLLIIGVVLVGVGLLSGLAMPIIKRLWTSSMVLFSGGICFLLMGLFYYWVDVWGFTFGLGWLRIYGMNAITAYVIGETINFRCIVASLTYGLAPRLGESGYDALLTAGNALILFFLLLYMYRRRIFVKI